LRSTFGVLLGDTHPQEISPGHYKLYDDVRGEIYGHANELTQEAYAQRVDAACAFLKGAARSWLESLEKDMLRAAEKKDFERAAKLRDILFAIRETTTPLRKFSHTKTPIAFAERGLEVLQQCLGLADAPRHIECFDISHISGTFTVASMVHFFNGRSDKHHYRRYKIRSFSGNDDFRAMEEVVERRYRRLHREKKSLPDLIVIDGGRGQVNAALKAFWLLNLPVPTLIGLAKREETIVFGDGREDLKLPHDNPGLQLLQRIRDEAHRFANTYSADLRSQKIRESILDDIPGLGPVRRAELLKRFKTVEGIRSAKLDDLEGVVGVGPRLAKAIYEGIRALKKRGDGSSEDTTPSSES
jgi:excinuclease ABC subunit C